MCIVPGCDDPARSAIGSPRGRGPQYCNRHHLMLWRNGHPEQQAIRKRDLVPYLKTIERHLRGPNGPAVVDYLEQVWQQLQDFATTTLAEAEQKPTSKWLKEACRNILIVAKEANAVEVGSQIAALYMLREDCPGMLKSDEAMRHQVARVFRILAPREVLASWWDHSAGKVRSTWLRTLPLRARSALADILIPAYAPVAGGFLGLLRSKEKARQDALERAREAFRKMQEEEYRVELERQVRLAEVG